MFTGRPARLWLSGMLGVMTLMPRPALAQAPARTFGELQSGSLSVTVDGRPRKLPAATIREVGKRRPDSRWNGTLIGAAIGIAAGAFAKAQNCGATDCGEGGLVDRAIRKFDTVFAASSAAPGFSLSLVLSRGVTGFQVSLAF